MKENINKKIKGITEESVLKFYGDSPNVSVMRNESGEGFMTSYEAGSGIYILYSDFHMSHLFSNIRRDFDCFAMDYCYEGRLECSLADGSLFYQKPGDLTMDNREKNINDFYFPLSHYHSLTVAFMFPEAQATVDQCLPELNINLKKLRGKFLEVSYPFYIRGNEEVAKVFNDLRFVKDKNQKSYMMIKVLELMMLLDSFEINELLHNREDMYFHKASVEAIKKMQKMMTNDLEHHYTLEELSSKFNVPVTAMTKCFKGVYGKPINSYMREYKMNYAAQKLLLTDSQVAEIGLLVGYSNPSKFSGAFKQVMGMLPKEYRKNRIYNMKG